MRVEEWLPLRGRWLRLLYGFLVTLAGIVLTLFFPHLSTRPATPDAHVVERLVAIGLAGYGIAVMVSTARRRQPKQRN